jgi:ABC-type nitrate/sulfonate/bicarbonate transport system ATPase subunit
VIHLVGLGYSAGRSRIVDGLDLSIELGRITALVGVSGCGKSTLLRLIAGLYAADPMGAGLAISGVPERRAFVFQDHALLPWLTLEQNVALPGRYRAGCADDVRPILARLGLAEHAHKLPNELSGGQRMRGSIARALASRPAIVFLDEAFAALDGITRGAVQADFQRVARAEGWTVLMVTHDLGEARRLADRVIVLRGPPVRVVMDLAAAELVEADVLGVLGERV